MTILSKIFDIFIKVKHLLSDFVRIVILIDDIIPFYTSIDCIVKCMFEFVASSDALGNSHVDYFMKY